MRIIMSRLVAMQWIFMNDQVSDYALRCEKETEVTR